MTSPSSMPLKRDDTSAAFGAYEITPDDNADNVPNGFSKGIWIGGLGNLAVIMSDGSEATLVNIQGGSLLPLRVRRVKATGTTATAIVALI